MLVYGSGAVLYAAAVEDTLIMYSRSMSSSVIVLNVFPAILTKLNCFFMLIDKPSKKQESSSLMYSFNVAPHQRPIFWIWLSKYPAKERGHWCPRCSESVCQFNQSECLCRRLFQECHCHFEGSADIFICDVATFAMALVVC
jgi:hypothetical protein